MNHFCNQKILPVAASIKDFEKLMKSKFEYIILLNSHIAQLQSLMQLAHRYRKKVLLHADLVQGLKGDEHGAEFLCQNIKPAGIISTRTPVVSIAKKRSIIAIQRIFLLDSHALNTGLRLLSSFQPDYIEVLPGVIPHIIKEVAEQIQTPILAGGFIRTKKEAEDALYAGAVAITTSSKELWSEFEK